MGVAQSINPYSPLTHNNLRRTSLFMTAVFQGNINMPVKKILSFFLVSKYIKSIIFLLLSMILYTCSLTQDCYYVDLFDPRAWSLGWGLLLFGWLGVPFGYIMWLANPLLFSSWYYYLFKKYDKSLIMSGIAFILMVSFLFCKEVVVGDSPMFARITGYGIGYLLWVLSSVFTITSNAFLVNCFKKSDK